MTLCGRVPAKTGHYVQLLKDAYNAQVHCSTSLTPFALVLSQCPLYPTTIDDPMGLQTHAKSITPPHIIPARLLHCVAEMRQDADKQLKTVRRRYKSTDNEKICKAPQTFYIGQILYIDSQPMTTCAADRLATG